MSEARALTNFAGNAVATVLIGTWTDEFDRERPDAVLAGDEPFDEATMIDDDDAVGETAETVAVEAGGVVRGAAGAREGLIDLHGGTGLPDDSGSPVLVDVTAETPRRMPEQRTRVAAIYSLGRTRSGSLVSDVGDGHKATRCGETRIVRLGQDVDRTSAPRRARRSPARCRPTREYAELIAMLGADHVRLLRAPRRCVTPRMPPSSEDAIEGILGVRPVVLAGLDEARARSWARPVTSSRSARSSSTSAEGRPSWWSAPATTSSPVGVARHRIRTLTERFLRQRSTVGRRGLPSAPEPTSTSILAPVVAALDPVGSLRRAWPAPSRPSRRTRWRCRHTTRRRSTAPAWPLDDVRARLSTLVQMSVADRRALPFMHPGRADVIGAGALILDRLVDHVPLSTDIMVGERARHPRRHRRASSARTRALDERSGSVRL